MEHRITRLWQRGLDYFNAGNLEAAQATFESILAREPRHGPARYRLALIAARRGRSDRAVELCEQVLAAEPYRAEVQPIELGCRHAGEIPRGDLFEVPEHGMHPNTDCASRAAMGVIGPGSIFPRAPASWYAPRA